ncbi:MAG: hypothetical protein EHM48_00795, partial [Planctomycetaceae bacterium]
MATIIPTLGKAEVVLHEENGFIILVAGLLFMDCNKNHKEPDRQSSQPPSQPSSNLISDSTTHTRDTLAVVKGNGDFPCVSFTINGREISGILELYEDHAIPASIVSCGGLTVNLTRDERSIFKEIPTTGTERLLLLVCGCGEEMCSCITVKVAVTADTVEWYSFSE